MEHVSNDHKDHPNLCKNSDKQHDEMWHPIVDMMESQRKLRQSHDRKANLEQILVPKEINKSKKAGLRELQSGIQVGKLTISLKSFEIITEFTRSISSTRIGKPVLMMDVKVSKDKHICRWVNQENLNYVR